MHTSWVARSKTVRPWSRRPLEFRDVTWANVPVAAQSVTLGALVQRRRTLINSYTKRRSAEIKAKGGATPLAFRLSISVRVCTFTQPAYFKFFMFHFKGFSEFSNCVVQVKGPFKGGNLVPFSYITNPNVRPP